MDPSQITYICPRCDNEMLIKPAHKGGWFYGCSKWPACNGSRSKVHKRPGPAIAVAKLRDMYGEAKWAEMEALKCSGKYKISPPPKGNKCLFGGMDPPNQLTGNCPKRKVYLKKCHFCGMDPCDHLGRNCPNKGIYFESQACDQLF